MSMTNTRIRRVVASCLVAFASLAVAGCSDDDNDGNPEVDVPEDVDVDVDQGEDTPGD